MNFFFISMLTTDVTEAGPIAILLVPVSPYTRFSIDIY